MEDGEQHNAGLLEGNIVKGLRHAVGHRRQHHAGHHLPGPPPLPRAIGHHPPQGDQQLRAVAEEGDEGAHAFGRARVQVHCLVDHSERHTRQHKH